MRRIQVLFRWMAALLFYLAAIRYSVLAQGQAGTVTALLDDALSAKQAQEICEQEAGQESADYVCFWGEVPDTAVQCSDTGKSSTVNMVLAQGSYELVMEGAGALAWEEDGCLVDTATAAELFGTEQADGQKLWCDGRESTVCGTFASLRPILIRRADAEDGAILGMVSAAAGGAQSSSGAGNTLTSGGMEQLLMRYSLSGDVVSFLFLCDLVHTLLLMFPLLCAFRLLVILWRALLADGPSGAEQSRALPDNTSDAGQPLCASSGASVSRRVVLFAAGVSILAASCYLIRKEFRIPADMIPTRWSDFSFWTAWWETQRRNLLLILGSAQGEAQLMALWNLLVSLFCNLLSMIAVR